MNVFNRLFTVTGLIALIVVGAATLVAPAAVLAFIQTAADTIHTSFFANMPANARVLVRLLLAIVFVLILLALLWLELRRPAQKTVEVGKHGGTTIRISTDAIESKLRDAIDNLNGVIGSKVLAQTRGKAVEVQLDVLATKDTDLVAKAEEVSALTRSIVQEQLGLKLHNKPKIVIKAGGGKAKVDRKPIFGTIGSSIGAMGRPGKDKAAPEAHPVLAAPDPEPPKLDAPATPVVTQTDNE